jgi:hypothetical protein
VQLSKLHITKSNVKRKRLEIKMNGNIFEIRLIIYRRWDKYSPPLNIFGLLYGGENFKVNV